jgi:alpha-tubulin suppressor-like RCC1 family protein
MPGPVIRPVTSTLTWKSVAAGDRSTCAIADDGTGWCWGQNRFGELGIGLGLNQPAPQRVGTGTWTQIAAGRSFACGLQPDGRLRCWGLGTSGQLGNGALIGEPMPVAVGQDEITDWVDVAAGETHACALRATGELRCWGDNGYGQLIAPLETPLRTVPTPITTSVVATWTKLALGSAHTCLIDDQAQLWCAGYAATGTLADGRGSYLSPAEVEGTWNTVTTGYQTSCAITSTNQLSCWGGNFSGEVGDGTTASRQRPKLLAGSWAAVSAGDHACGLSTAAGPNGWCWGKGNDGRLGIGGVTDSAVPVATSFSLTYSEIVASIGGHSCGLVGQSAYCWGNNNYGQAGQPPGNLAWNPALVAGSFRSITAGLVHSCAIRTDNTIACWGYNGFGALGDTSFFITDAPQVVTIPTSRSFSEVAAGQNHSCARAETDVWCWGANEHGQVGKGSTSRMEFPFAITGSWRSIAAGGNHTCGVRSDHTLACWGANEFGQLGIGSMFPRNEPVTIGTDQDWDRVFVGMNHTCALKDGGRLFCWGVNGNGQLGLDTAWRPDLVMVEN